MTKLILISALLFSFNVVAYNESDLAKIKALNGCDLSGVNFSTSDLRDAQLNGARYCKTKMPWGELNNDCEE